ncbi:MAG: TRAP transporter fused permease subunit [Methylobacteriaceae bacterium]|jgi:TRAP transporter 4TM/12TM fusion protein|nr:TRAP transporter fused permease subunit [Methylobacteriaceae bacterium]
MKQNAALSGVLKILCTITALAMVFYQCWFIVALPFEPSVNGVIHLGFAFVVLLLSRLSVKLRWKDFLFLAASVAVTAYFFFAYERILQNPAYPPTAALVAGVVGAVIAFYLTYRVFGLIFPIITVVGILYLWLGSYLPGALHAPTMEFKRMIVTLAADVTSPWGLYGSLLILSANYLFLFIIFGAVLEAFGGLNFIMSIGNWAAGHFRSGAAALSIISSALLGSITGSTVANITITGTFTIPLMKKTNYTAEQAAAIETAASCGGQILPPVMGATVFVMSGFTGISYFAIAKASVVSALIYFGLLLFYAELNARKRNIQPLQGQAVDTRALLLSAPVFILPLALLLMLLYLGRSLMRTIYYCILAVVVLGLFFNLFQRNKLKWRDVVENIVRGAVSGSQIAVVLALIGVAVACVEVTGLGMKLGGFLVTLSMNNLHMLLLLTAVTAIILGIGLPSPAAYIICATILSPAIHKMGVPLLQAHLFPLYFALFSHLTPPVGIGLMVACKMANSDYLKSAVEALKAAFPSFFLPFLFVYSPGILLAAPQADIVLSIIGTVLFFVTLGVILNRYFAGAVSGGVLALLLAAFFALGVFLVDAGHPLPALGIGAALLVTALVINVRRYKAAAG